MASIKIVLKDQQKKDGTYPILIRVIIGRKPKYFSTGYAVKSSQFKDGLVIRHPDLVLINRAIETKRAAIAEQVYLADIEGKAIEVDELGFSKKPKGTFLNALTERMNFFEENNRVASYLRLKAKRKLLRDAWGKDLKLSDLSGKWVDKYISFRISKGAKVITVKKDLSEFSSILNNSVYEGKDWFRLAQKRLKAEPVSKEKLTLSEIDFLETAKLSGVNDVARDMFLFAYYCQGMRFENVATFHERMIKNGSIKYRMNKGKKVREIPIHRRLQNIIDKYLGGEPYLFPIVKKKVTDNWSKKNLIDSANALINTHLKRVAIICGIDKNLSSHVARHSFAYLTMKRKVPISIIKDALGHSSISTTQVYLQSFSDDEINEAVKGLYD